MGKEYWAQGKKMDPEGVKFPCESKEYKSVFFFLENYIV